MTDGFRFHEIRATDWDDERLGFGAGRGRGVRRIRFPRGESDGVAAGRDTRQEMSQVNDT